MKKLFTILFLLFLLLSNSICLADSLSTEMAKQSYSLEGTAELNNQLTIGDIVSNVIKIFLSLLAIIFIVLIIYAGYNWMTAGGDEQKVTTAKQTLQRAIIGLIIIIAAYSITYFVFNALDGVGSGGALGPG